jgi:hypothetical protein
MPQPQPSDPGTRRERVPVGIFLPEPHHPRPEPGGERPLRAWGDLAPRSVARLIATYTRAGDVVIDADGCSTIARASRYLRRHPATAFVEETRSRIRISPPGRHAFHHRHGAGLILVTLPVVDGTDDDRHALTLGAWMRRWRRLLRPGGFLLTMLPNIAPVPGTASPRSTVITAARTAGLIYQQHLLIVTRRLAEDEPRALPESAATTRPALRQGRHVSVHRDLLAFATATTEGESTHV